MDRIWAPWRMSYINNMAQENGCIFCKASESPEERDCLVLSKTEYSLIMLNRYPYTNGHLMASPRRHTADLDMLTDKELLDLMHVVRCSRNLLMKVIAPDGFNIGVNLGKAAGAGIEDHLHIHVVPRWAGDTNYMTVVGDVRVIPEDLMVTYDRLFSALKDSGFCTNGF